MTDFDEYMKRRNKAQNKKIRQLSKERIQLDLDETQFQGLICSFAKDEMIKKRIPQSFVIDRENEDLIHQLYLYVTANKEFEGSLGKGILLSGSYGTGKTLIMTAFCKIINESRFNQTKIKLRTAKELFYEFGFPSITYNRPSNPIENYRFGGLYIDDIGKENNKVFNYGSELNPITDILMARYDRGSVTFGTINNNILSLSKHYSGSIGDRIKEMFNTLTLNGHSRR